MKFSQLKKLIGLGFTTALLAGVFLFIITGGDIDVMRGDPLANDLEFSAFESALEPIYGLPKKVIIDSVNLMVGIEPVGVDIEGYLETPKDWETAGWYKNSARPSESGNLIINAHYNDTYGKPAAFWSLKSVNVDDTVTVLDSFGKAYDYKITESFYVDISDPERLRVFDNESEIPALTLITCGGVFLPGEGTYNKRLVVSAELISSK